MSVICPLCLFFDRIQEIVHHFSRGSGGTLDGVGINFGGGVGCAVAQGSRHGGDRHAVGNLERCIGMPQAVNVDLGEIGSFDEATEPAC